MSKRLVGSCHALLAALWVSLAGCNLDSDLPVRNGSAAPVSSGVTLSGGGAQDAADASSGYGENTRITDIKAESGGSRATPAGTTAGSNNGGADDGGAFEAGMAEAGGAAGATVQTLPPSLWFSEYVEGSSSNKALEITARARSVLDGCKVGTYFNGKSEATIVASLSGVLEAGQVLTLCSSMLKEKLAGTCNQISNLTFNGDDVVVLSCDGMILDVIGQIGVDPGAAWGSDTNSTADHTLRRSCTVPSGDPLGSDAFDPSTEWQAFPVDTFDGLGSLGC